MDNKTKFQMLCKDIHRDGIDDLMEWLERGDFYTAPASSRFHGAYEGGLLAHSLNVYAEMEKLLATYKEIECSKETLAICSLFHDVCKIGYYTTEKRNRKNEQGIWESYDAYKVDERYKFGGHGGKSVYLVQNFIRLTPEEAAAINSHMGAFDNENVGRVYEQFPVAWILHVADEAATYLVESGSVNFIC